LEPASQNQGSFLFEGGNAIDLSGGDIRTLGEEDGMSTLAVVEAILREAAMPLSVREIVERAGDALPTKSKTPDTVVARDLSMDIKKKAEASTFVRTSPGRYAIRERALAEAHGAETRPSSAPADGPPALSSTPASPMTATAPTPSTSTISGPSAPPTLADPSAVATPLVGQSLSHDRSGARPAPAKGPSKPQSNSEDTPLSA
jgi:HB1, ASXL, restriction endonuclease HTH domain